jgi:hypothetical protein
MGVFNLTSELASLLTNAGFSCCGTPSGLSLDALAAHNKIEHDASLFHDDAPVGAEFAPTKVNATLLREVLSKSPDGLTVDTFARLRMEREKALPAPLDSSHEPTALGESALILLTMADPTTGVVPVEKLEVWLGQERLPDTFTIPSKAVGLDDASRVASMVAARIQELGGI